MAKSTLWGICAYAACLRTFGCASMPRRWRTARRARCRRRHCREDSWQNRSPLLADAQFIGRFERNGFACLEFLTAFRIPNLPSGKVEQHHVSGHLVRDGYWVDMHLSLMPYTPKDRQAFLDFVDAIQVAPKGQ